MRCLRLITNRATAGMSSNHAVVPLAFAPIWHPSWCSSRLGVPIGDGDGVDEGDGLEVTAGVEVGVSLGVSVADGFVVAVTVGVLVDDGT